MFLKKIKVGQKRNGEVEILIRKMVTNIDPNQILRKENTETELSETSM